MAMGKPARRLFTGSPAPHEGALIPALQELQEKLRHLPAAGLAEISERLGIPLSRVFGVATFYSQFSLQPRGKHVIRVCLGTACHVRGASQVLEELHRRLAVGEDGLSADGLVSVEPVRCLGACALAPVVVGADGRYFGGMTPAKVGKFLQELRGGERG
jgi:NADH-quinone oxidoreductase subunit E